MIDPNVISSGETGGAKMDAELISVPLLATREPVIYPFSLTPLLIEGDNVAALHRAMESDRLLALFPELPSDEELEQLVKFRLFSYEEKRRSAVGVLVRVVKELNFPDGSIRIVVRGVRRIICAMLSRNENEPPMARCRTLPELPGGDEVENQARQKSLTVLFQELAGMLPGLPEELQVAVFNAGTPGRFADLLADALNFSYAEKLLLLFHTDVRARLEALAVFMNRELEVLKLGMKIQNEVHQAMSQSQREFFLREQLRSIQQELGEDTRNPDIIEIERRLGELTLQVRDGLRRKLLGEVRNVARHLVDMRQVADQAKRAGHFPQIIGHQRLLHEHDVKAAVLDGLAQPARRLAAGKHAFGGIGVSGKRPARGPNI